MSDYKISPEALLHLAADSARMPGFSDSLAQLLEAEYPLMQTDELDEDTLSLAAGGISAPHEECNKAIRKE